MKSKRSKNMKYGVWTLVVLAMLLLIVAFSANTAALTAYTKTYTLDTDFDLGTLINVNHDAPNNDQLQLGLPQPLPFVNIAASDRGTTVRMNVTTGQVLGEYSTNPDAGVSTFPNPSRTTVDQLGNVWVANRGESTLVGDVLHGSVTRIGLIIGGIRVDFDGTPNPVGQYVHAPAYNTCVDRHGTTPGTAPDGLIKTSTGLGNILTWTNGGGADTYGGVSTADDECIINYVLTPGTGTRTVAIDANNDVWVGNIFGTNDHNHIRVQVVGSTTTLDSSSLFNPGCGGYGGFIDGNQVLWSSGRHTGLLRYDINTSTAQCLTGRGDYGLGLDPNTGHIWHSGYSTTSLYELDAAGNLLNTYPQGFQAQGVVVDSNSHVWVAEVFGSDVAHFAPNSPGPHIFVGNVTGFAGTTGVAVDSNGKVWASEISSTAPGGPGTGRGAARIDPTTGPVGFGGFNIGAIDLTVGLDYAGMTVGAAPYNYSDMTGFVLGVIKQGNWTVVQDSGLLDANWQEINWNIEPEASEPPGTLISVEARAANTLVGLGSETFVPVTNGGSLALTGQYIEVQTTLEILTGSTSPVLSDLTIIANRDPECDEAVPSVEKLWPPNHRFWDIDVLGVTDPDGDPVTITIDAIWQDEHVDERGDGRFAPDGDGVGTSTASVRAERSGRADGRFYHIFFTADDGKGGTCSSVVRVVVDHDRSRKPPVDGGPLFDSTIVP